MKRLTYLEYGPKLLHSLDSRNSTHIPSTVELTVVAIHIIYHVCTRKGHSFSLPRRARLIIRAYANEHRIATRMHLGSIDELGFYEKEKPSVLQLDCCNRIGYILTFFGKEKYFFGGFSG